jgi:hypothetical protein
MQGCKWTGECENGQGSSPDESVGQPAPPFVCWSQPSSEIHLAEYVACNIVSQMISNGRT